MGESVLTSAAPAESPLYADAGLERRGGSLYFGGVALTAIADAVGTPAYLYNAGVIRRQFRATLSGGGLGGRPPPRAIWLCAHARRKEEHPVPCAHGSRAASYRTGH